MLINDLLNIEGRIYVYLKNDAVARRFLKDAEAEGFSFGDKAKPTLREPDNIFAVNPDKTINYVGIIGHMAFTGTEESVKPIVRIDYEKFAAGAEDYIIKSTPNDFGKAVIFV